MDAYDRSSAIEHATLTRVAEIYTGALRRALKNKQAFLKKVKDVETGKIKPPKYYVDTNQVAKWKEGFLRELMRQDAVIDGIIKELNKAGVEASELIRGSMVKIYQANRKEAVSCISRATKANGVNISFAQYDKNQIATLIQQNESPFSKIAYKNMGENPAIRRKLQTEMGVATILGEGQRDIIKRIQKITGQSYNQAKRVAQTERTRIQSQARWQTGQEAAAMGVNIVNEWSTRMVNSRDSHVALNGEKKPQGEPFKTIWGNELLYPGDPKAPAEEVINCHCVLVPDVVTDQALSGGSSGAKKTHGWKSRHAELYYEEVRNRKSGVDAKKIAKYTMFTEKAVEEIRQHMFIRLQPLDNGTRIARFDPSYRQAQAWQRLTEGKGDEVDVLLLKHEYYELTKMRLHGYNYDEAHALTDLVYNWWQAEKEKRP